MGLGDRIVTNEDIGRKLELSHSAVSRLRRGERLPSVEVMVRIASHFGWDVVDQVAVRVSDGAGVYAEHFERHIQKAIDNESKPVV